MNEIDPSGCFHIPNPFSLIAAAAKEAAKEANRLLHLGESISRCTSCIALHCAEAGLHCAPGNGISYLTCLIKHCAGAYRTCKEHGQC